MAVSRATVLLSSRAGVDLFFSDFASSIIFNCSSSPVRIAMQINLKSFYGMVSICYCLKLFG